MFYTVIQAYWRYMTTNYALVPGSAAGVAVQQPAPGSLNFASLHHH